MSMITIRTQGGQVTGTTATYSNFQALTIVNQGESEDAILTLTSGQTVRIKPGQALCPCPPMGGQIYGQHILDATATDCDVILIP